MSIVSFRGLAPPSSGDIPVSDPDRLTDLESKHALVTDYLKSQNLDAIILQKPGNFSWFTSGGDCSRGGYTEPTAALLITADARVLVCGNVDSGQLFDRQLYGLGFQLKERPWHEPRQVLIDDLCRGRMVVSDTGVSGTKDVSQALLEMRQPLNELEITRLKETALLTTHAVEATARQFKKGQTEAEIAGELSHRMIKHDITPVRLQVMADGQGHRYRHWGFGADTVERYCVISAVGRRQGLCVGITRTVSFGEPPKTIRTAHHRALLMQATGMYFSQPGWEFQETWQRVARIYEKFECPDEWQHADQADLIGYEISEAALVPKSDFTFQPGMAVHWHPSVGPATVSDTILIGESAFENLTPSEGWPRLTVEVKRTPIQLSDILCREAIDYQDEKDSHILLG